VEWSAPWGVPLAQHGFVVLALAYFGTDPLPVRLQSIPLEYFTRAIESLHQHPMVDRDRVGLMGFSKGAEGALLIASTHSSIRAVIAAAPSHVAWPGITGNPRDEAPSWTLGGVAVPFVSYDRGQTFATSLDAYTHSLANDSAVAAAAIRVERINGPILLLSGTDDRVWPAATMAERIVERLRGHQFRFPATHRRFDGAGHAVLASPATSGAAPSRSGGTPDANAQARTESSRLAVEFLVRALLATSGPAAVQASPATATGTNGVR
jgi:dienelactone hydrolase